MGLELGMTFKLYTRVATVLKLKFRKLCGLISTLIEITGKKLVGERKGGGGGLPPILNRVKPKKQVRNHSCSVYRKVPERLTFLTP